MSQHRKKQTASRRLPKLVWTLIGIGVIVALVQVVSLVWSAVSAGDDNQSTASQVTPETTSGPYLTADRDTIDLGKVQLGKSVQAQFELANDGDQPLRFTQKPYIEVVQGC